MDTLSVSDALALQGRKDEDGFEGGWSWIIILFILILFGGGNGFFGRNACNGEISNDFLYTNLNNTVGQGFTQIANQNFGIDKSICQSTGVVTQAINNLGYQQQNCCCETNRNIDSVRYENQKNTCDITTAIHNEAEQTRALITANVMQELRDNLQAANLQLGNISQTQTLINALQPVAKPAYITCSPYTSYNPYSCGFTGNCGSCC